MVWYHIDKKKTNETWALAAIAIINSGAIRASTEPGIKYYEKNSDCFVWIFSFIFVYEDTSADHSKSRSM